jgi:hypothetical protein
VEEEEDVVDMGDESEEEEEEDVSVHLSHSRACGLTLPCTQVEFILEPHARSLDFR